jgi:hypothetical protein
MQQLLARFQEFKIEHVPRGHNGRADLLAKLASTKKAMNNRSIVVEVVKSPIIKKIEVSAIEETAPGWAKPIVEYIQGKIPEDKEVAKRLARQAANYTIVGDILYRHGFSQPLLRRITQDQAEYVIEEIHSGVCRSHIGGRSLATKVLRVGYYWPTLRDDCIHFVKLCEKCQVREPL